MNRNEINLLIEETYGHLWNGRNRLALSSAKKLYENNSGDSESAVLYAWALMENGHPAKALEYANLSVELNSDQLKAKLFRGYILQRMGINEGSLSDTNYSLEEQKKMMRWAYANKGRSLAGIKEYGAAIAAFDKALSLSDEHVQEWERSKRWCRLAEEAEIKKNSIDIRHAKKLLDETDSAIKQKDSWFALAISRLILSAGHLSGYHREARLVEIDALYNMYRLSPALEIAEKVKEIYKGNEKFGRLLKRLRDYKQEIENEKSTVTEEKRSEENGIKKIPENIRTDAEYFENPNASIFSAKMFDVNEHQATGKKKYYIQFDKNNLRHVGVEVIFDNPYFEDEDREYKCRSVWYMQNRKLGQNSFSLNVRRGWDAIIFSQTWGSEVEGAWKNGQCFVELFIEEYLVCRKYFSVGIAAIEAPENGNKPEPEAEEEKERDNAGNTEFKKHEVDGEKKLEELLAELDEYTGLGSVKKGVKDLISYLEFVNERKKLGLKAEESVVINALFLGNPGTGKTTVARMLGNIFRAMGILEKGHVIETDRAGLVGQYVGETAQKTEAIIKEAEGGILFIDEAYTLYKKGGSGQDFGQEAIDILLKRMEDSKGSFAVIAAGYPKPMEDFLTSNPGLKSRFTHSFTFEDYTPEELLQIYTSMLGKEDYKLSDDAYQQIKKEFTRLYRQRDESFGNARMVRKFAEDTKLQLSKRFLELPEDKRTEETITTITSDDVKKIIITVSRDEVSFDIDEEALEEAMDELNGLVGLRQVFNEITDTVKLARYYIEQGENVRDKFSSHIIFQGNPGTGKTTVARIISKIYSSLGILSRGHLVETDRAGLVSGYIGQTAEKTTSMIDKAMGGTLFIDEAYTLTPSGGSSDFGKEAVDTLLKRMEDDRGKFIVIAAGYPDEMSRFIKSNPGLQSRFTRTYNFEDYNPDDLMEITRNIITAKNLKIEKKASSELYRYYNDIYRTRDKNFGNARIVRNIIDGAVKKMNLRAASLPKEKRNDKINRTIMIEDIAEVMPGKESDAQKYEIKGDPRRLQVYLDELKSMTGLDSVKEDVEKLISGLKVAGLRKSRGLKVIEKSLHSVFLGNPGTGKTTVARLMSKIYREMGLLEKGHLVEADRASLVAGYQGQTAMKTDRLIKSALGGTLFIDEAYTLVRGGEYGIEAIDTLLKRMEDYRGQFVVITAGYTDEMKEFIHSNPGIESRFTNFFTFDDYKPRQLVSITVGMAEKNGYKFDEGALQSLMDIFTRLYENRDKNFGNARAAKNILYKAISNQEIRITENYSHSDEDLETIRFEDVEKLKKEVGVS